MDVLRVRWNHLKPVYKTRAPDSVSVFPPDCVPTVIKDVEVLVAGGADVSTYITEDSVAPEGG